MPDPQNWYDAAPPVQPAIGPILGPPPKPDKPAIPMGYEPDPAKPGGLRPQEGGPADPNGGDSLDPKTVTFYAQQVLSGAPMPAMGMGKQASIMRQKVMEEVARQAGGQGKTGADLARQITHYKAQSANITNLEKQLGTVSQSEQTALANGQQLIDLSNNLPGQGGGPILNTITQAWERAVPFAAGHDQISAYDAAYTTFVNEYAKVVSGSPSGAGVLSDAARHEAQETLRKSTDPSQKRAAFEQMKKDMANRIAASRKVIDSSYDNLTNQPGYQVPDNLALASLPGASPPPGGGSNGGGDGTDGGGPPPPGVSALDDNQRKAYDAFLAANPLPSGDAIGAFLSKLTGHQVTNGDAIAKAIAHGQGVNTTIENKTLADKVSARVAQMKAAGDGAGTAAGVGAADALTLGAADEINAFGRSIGGALKGEGSFGDLWDVNSTANKAMEQSLQTAHPLAYTGGQLAGGLALAPLGGTAPAAEEGIGALAAYGAKNGAAFGSAYGFGSGEGVNRFTDAATGAVTGGAVGALAPYAGKFVADKVGALRAARGLAPDVADAARAEGVDLIRPMVDPASRGKFGALESAPGSQNVIRAGVDKVKGQIEGRVAALGQDGVALEPGAAGERLQLSGNQYIQRSRGIKNRLYSAAENAGGDTRFVPQKAIEQADKEIAALQSNPQTNAGEIKFMQGVRDDLAAPGGKTVAEIRNIRTGLRGAIGNSNLTMSGAEARANSILSAAGDDISQAVPQAGRLYKRADAFYRERQTVVDDIKRSILGQKNNPLDPQTAFANIKTLAAPGGNLRRLSAVTRYLEPDERADVAATVASTIGRKAQDAPFSTDLFLSQTDKMSPGALNTIFGPDGAQSIANLRLLSRKLQEGVGDTNRSKTANSVMRQMASKFVASLTGLGGTVGMLEGGLHGGGAGALTGLAAGSAVKGVQVGRNVLSARAMVNPRVSQWLAQSAEVSTPAQAKQAVSKLTLVISREPALAQELTPIRDFLDQRVTQLLAANPNGQDQQQN